MARLSFYPIADSYLVVLAAALGLMGLIFWVPWAGGLNNRRRKTLLALRIAVVALVVLAMLRPTLIYTKTSKQSATLVLLADQTRSMTVPDEVNNRSRFEAMRRALADASSTIRRLDRDFEVKAYGFDGEVRPLDVVDGAIRLPDKPLGQQSAIGYALDTVLREAAGKRLLGVLLMSDGAQRAYPPHDALPQTAASQMKAAGDLLYTFPFGKARGLGEARDVAVTDVLANPRVFVKNELTVTGQLRAYGYTNTQLSVRMLYEQPGGRMETVAMESVKVAADGQLVPFQLRYVPEAAGERKITVEAVPQPGELVTTNNQMSTFVQVMKGGLNVLYLEGTLRQETPFLRRSLDSSADINVDYIRIDAQRPETRPADLADRFRPGRYDVYLIGDLDASAFSESDLAQLAECVSKGAGLLMMGGFHSFGPGGYADTPLAAVLPVSMDKLERQRFGEEPRADLHLAPPVKMRPTDIGLAHFTLILAANRGQNAQVWESLPPLDGANRFDASALKPSALKLAVGDHDEPLLVAQVFGEGRTMAFAGDSTWRWWMRGFEAAHRRFWRQMILWLARKDEALEGNVWVKLAQRRYGPGQRVDFGIGAQSPLGETLSGVEGEGEIRLPDGSTQPLTLTTTNGDLGGSFRTVDLAGDYTLRVTVRQGDRPLGTAQARFLVADHDLELDNAAADVSQMENLAAITGGKAMAPEELPALLAELAEKAEKLEDRVETKQTLWDTWPFFLSFVALLGMEWYLRKRWGMV